MEIFSWGANSYGQLGLGNMIDQLLPQRIAEIPYGAGVPIMICGGGGHMILMTDCGSLFVCGWDNCGQLGTGSTRNLMNFEMLTWESRIRTFACGWNHTLFVSDSGECFSFGSNAFLQLGCSKKKMELNPVKVEGIQDKVKVVAAGLRHSVALTESGEVYCWGSGRKGQLGTEAGLLSSVQTPNKVAFDKGILMKDIRAGAEFTSSLSDDGEVYCWGSNVHGQCGLPGAKTPSDSGLEIFNKVLRPTKVGLDEKITKIHAGWSHMLAISESGKMYSWGRGDYGQLGNSDFQSRCNPSQISFGSGKIIALSGGSEHNIAIDDDSRLFVWGWNEHGMCATGDEENVGAPRQIELFADKKPVLIGCGAGTSFVCIQGNQSTNQ